MARVHGGCSGVLIALGRLVKVLDYGDEFSSVSMGMHSYRLSGHVGKHVDLVLLLKHCHEKHPKQRRKGGQMVKP